MAIPASSGSRDPSTSEIWSSSSSRPGRPVSARADSWSVYTAIAPITGMVSPSSRDLRTNTRDLVCGADVVEHGDVGAGSLLLDQPRGPETYRRGRRRLRDADRQAVRGGEGSEPRPIQVEDLGHLRAHAGCSRIPGDAEDAVDTDVAEARQLLLEDHPVAIAAGERDPRGDAEGAQEPGHECWGEVRLILVLTDEQSVARAAQDAGEVGQGPCVVRREGQVCQDRRPPRPDRTEQRAARSRRDVSLRAPVRRRGAEGERAAPRIHLAGEVGTDPTTGTEDHALGTVVLHLVAHPPILPAGRKRARGTARRPRSNVITAASPAPARAVADRFHRAVEASDWSAVVHPASIYLRQRGSAEWSRSGSRTRAPVSKAEC